MFERPIEGGRYEGRVIDREQYEDLLDLYYEKRGWSKDGLPPDDRSEAFRDSLV
jgi:hypothetical protein